MICIAAMGRGYGKTFIIEGVTRILASKGLKVCVIKHSAHTINEDHGKDTARFRESGAVASAILTRSGEGTIYLSKPTIETILSILSRLGDIILCEGFKSSPFPKLIIAKSAKEFPKIAALCGVIGIIFDGTPPELNLPVLKKDPSAVADFILSQIRGDGKH